MSLSMVLTSGSGALKTIKLHALDNLSKTSDINV